MLDPDLSESSQVTLQSSIIAKSIAILELLGDAGRPQTLTEIARAGGLNKSTTHRLLSNLTLEGLAQYDASSKTYTLGHKLLQLARKAWRGFDIQAIAMKEMLHLHSLVCENVSIGIIQGNEVMHLRMIESKYHWGIVQPPIREPIHTSATGKAITAYLPSEILATWLNQHEFHASTKRSITSREAFEKELADVREVGFATNDREELDYVVGIASPIFNFMGEPIAALDIWAPTNRCTLVDMLPWSDILISASDRVSKLIGGSHDRLQPTGLMTRRPSCSSEGIG